MARSRPASCSGPRYNRYGGVMHMLAALDLATGKIYYRIRKRKRWQQLPAE
jgi:hypothetical protein